MKKINVFIVIYFSSFNLFAQIGQKEVSRINQTWVSLNGNIFLNKHYFIQTDIHFRENDFFATNSFFLGRVGIGYQFNPSFQISVGYAYLNAAPIIDGYTTRASENRIYQQFGYNYRATNKILITQRIRNEQRWQEIVINDSKTGNTRFTNRFRYLLGFNFYVFKNPKMPQLVVSDEIHLQFGKDIVYNTFDQNRLFIGIKQKLSNSISFDFGYMDVFQKRSNGYSYLQSNTLRLFVYYNHPSKKNQ